MRRPRDAGDAAGWADDEDPGGPSGSLDGGGDGEAPRPAQGGPGDAMWRWRSQGLSEVVLSWSVEQILDKDMLRDKVSKIPETFSTMEQYITSFFAPLLEEVKGDMYSSMEDISNAPSTKVLSVYSKRKGKGQYDIKVDRWKGTVHGCGTDNNYKPKAADVLLISDTRPQNPSDILKQSKSCVIVWVVKVERNSMTVKASRRMETGADCDERRQVGFNKYDKQDAEDLDEYWDMLDQEAMAPKSSNSSGNGNVWKPKPKNGEQSSLQDQNGKAISDPSRRWSFFAMYLTNMVTYDRVWVVLRRGLTMDSKIVRTILSRNNYVSF